jgi:mannose-1-phosphate guanylyltransferase
MTDGSSAERCSIVLAAGEGKRLQAFVQRLRGDTLPKQYVNFVGNRSLLAHTFARAERIIHPQRIFTVVSQEHLRYPDVRRQLSTRADGTVVVQPENKETGPGLLLPLAHLYKRYPDSAVVVLPSDHFIIEEERFMAHVDLACRVVEQYPHYLILLGAQPHEPETEYGYILPGGKLNHLAPLSLRPVVLFKEKPTIDVARDMLTAGALWNTMVMVCKANTLVDLVHGASPRLSRFFEQISNAIGTSREREVLKEAYRRIEPVNFSSGLLEVYAVKNASNLLVLPVHGVVWSDWGSERRLIGSLKEIGYANRLNGVEEKIAV